MNQKQGKRSSRKATYYDRQFARTTQNKNRAAARIVRRKTEIPKPPGWAERYAVKRAPIRLVRLLRSNEAHLARIAKVAKMLV